MITKDAIEAIQHGAGIADASGAIRDAIATGSPLGLPNNYTLHDIERFLPVRRRMRGTMETSSIADFARYVAANKEAGACVFVAAQAIRAEAVLNMGTPEKPGHADNRAGLRPEATAAYSALKQAADGRPLPQSQVAEFLEDWAQHITCFGDDGSEIPTRRAIAAVRKITIDALRKVEACEQQLSVSKSTFESVSASSKDPMPRTIHFSCVPFHGIDARVFVLRLGVRAGDIPALTLRIVNAEEHHEQMAQELAEKVRAAIAEACPVMVGEYASAM